MAHSYPRDLRLYVERCLSSEGKTGRFAGLPYDLRDNLSTLPSEEKTALLSSFKDVTETRRMLLSQLVGDDVDWLEEILGEGLISPDEALLSYNGRQPQPSMTQLAYLLIPRGLDPHKIAIRAELGSWSGEESHHYRGLVQSFDIFAKSDDPTLIALGMAGVEIYSPKLEKAAEKEERQDIFGDYF